MNTDHDMVQDEPDDSYEGESNDEQNPPTCAGCNRSIGATFYALSDMNLCPDCRDTIVWAQTGGSKVMRALKALALGIAAAIVGAILYYAILKFTGVHFGLIAIVVGILVGKAVHKGSKGRGGLFYQFLAVFLTYTSIAATNIPMIIEVIKQDAANKPVAANPPAAKKPAPSIGRFLVALTVFTGILLFIAFQIPVIHAINGGGILLIILALGLWQAWKLNRRVVLPIEGPFSYDGLT